MDLLPNATKHDKLSAECVPIQLPFGGFYFTELLSPLTDRRNMQSPLWLCAFSSRVVW